MELCKESTLTLRVTNKTNWNKIQNFSKNGDIFKHLNIYVSLCVSIQSNIKEGKYIRVKLFDTPCFELYGCSTALIGLVEKQKKQLLKAILNEFFEKNHINIKLSEDTLRIHLF